MNVLVVGGAGYIGSHAVRLLIDAGHNVWVYDLSRETFSPLTHRWDQHGLVWTPDGERVLFNSDRGGAKNVFWKSADGSGNVEQLLAADQWQWPFSVSPQGEVLAYDQAHPSRGWDVLMYSMDGEREPREFLVTEFNERGPRFSPDGHWIAYHSDETGRWEVYVTPFPGPGRKWQISAAGGTYVRWLPGGDGIVYQKPEGGLVLTEIDGRGDVLAVGPSRDLLATAPSAAGGITFDVAPGAKRYLVMMSGIRQAPSPLYLVVNWERELRDRH